MKFTPEDMPSVDKTQLKAEAPSVFIQCTNCGKFIEIPVTQSRIEEWRRKNTFIQNEFPELTPSQREMLLSGICESCWNEIFKDDEDEE